MRLPPVKVPPNDRALFLRGRFAVRVWWLSHGESNRSGLILMVDITAQLERLIPHDRIADFARRWRITELALFGSVLRDDFDADSDVDVLVSFDPAATWSLWDLTTMQDELAAIIGRKVELVEKEGLRNPFRRRRILSGREVVYVGSER